MKLELKKETNLLGVTQYWIYKDGHAMFCFPLRKEAEAVYNKIIEERRKEKIKVLKSEVFE